MELFASKFHKKHDHIYFASWYQILFWSDRSCFQTSIQRTQKYIAKEEKL